MNVGYRNGERERQRAGRADWEAVKDEVTETAEEAVNVARERSRHFAAAARDRAAHYVDRRKDSAAQSVEDIASSLRDSGQAFEDRPNIKAFMDSAAEGLEHLAEEIRGRTLSELYGDVEDFARRRPTTFAAAAGVAGFMLARLLKSTAEQAEDRRESLRRSRTERSDFQTARV